MLLSAPRPVASALAAALIGTLFTASAFAAASLSDSGTNRTAIAAHDADGDPTTPPEQINQGGAGQGSASANSGPITSTSSVDGVLDYGVLKGNASAQVTVAAAGGTSGTFGSSSAQLALSASDTLTVTSDSLADGTDVSFDVLIVFDRMLDASGNFAFSSGRAAATIGQSGDPGSLTLQIVDSVPDAFGLGGAPFSISGVYDTTVGASFDLLFQMSLNVAANYDGPGSDLNSIATADASNSAYLYLIARDSSYGYTAASGSLNYAAQPVPEPETYAMMLAGLGLIGFAARRRMGARLV